MYFDLVVTGIMSQCLCHMLYCIATSKEYNLAFFVAKRIDFVTKQAQLILPYGMLLTRLFDHVMSENPELSKDCYVLYHHIMYPLTTQQERKTQKDYGTKRGRPSTSTSSSFTFGQPSSSHHIDDDNDGNDEGTSCASTPSPTHFVSSFSDDIHQVFSNPQNIYLNMKAFYTRKTKNFNRQVQLCDKQRGGLRSIEKGINNLPRGKNK
nr:pentatricopeptide repeat-containing protein [Tanacetum cinerariifolium]GEZ15548.1 pentatricopeptide repeat-containing protein [Tanacetum cinerariifolium]